MMRHLGAVDATCDGRPRRYGAARMWKGYRDALAAYYNACLDAYEARGFVNGPTMQRVLVPEKVEMPPWLGDERFHAA